MAASARKKKEKKKDFQKAKLKVGKTKARPDSFTSTSFKAKSIVLNPQSLATSAPSPTLQFNHHLSLLTSKSENQRRDSLAYLTTAVASGPLPQPLAVILEKIRPLLLDSSHAVRQQLNKLLRALPAEEITSNAGSLILLTRAGMTHLSNDVRLTALDAFEWLLETAGKEVVGIAGVWVKTLKCFLGLLGWQKNQDDNAENSKWSIIKQARARLAGADKIFVKQLLALTLFLDAGIGQQEQELSKLQPSTFPLWHTQFHMLPHRPNPYGYLNLAGAARDEESEAYEDRLDRQRVFKKLALAQVEDGLEQARKEGGEVGRAAAALRRAVNLGMMGFVE
ncbi:pre-rRNA-processing protein-like protein ipi1 [Viridothelium virens]|uniref:Pre-rRNA-processing protein n=1 Tax=Viridothelium virens TaxID=1048519 RepID=A0A6A6HK17_VIRVR|nr:pre-rRNA-processing protein-like protein ipi1 [Viridothelium virens]